MTPDLIIPADAVQIVADHCFGERKSMGEGTAREIAAVALSDASPLVVAAELEQLAAGLREVLHRLPEYTHGCLAWRVMNDIDNRIVALRSEEVGMCMR